MSEQLLRLPEVIRMVGLKKSAVYALIAQEGFPRPRQIGRRAVAWRLADVEVWILNRPTTGDSPSSLINRDPFALRDG